MAIGLSFKQNLGIDIECIKTLPLYKKIAKRFFGAEILCNSQEAFYQLWTQKEAFVKMKGKHIFDDEFRHSVPKSTKTFTLGDYVGAICLEHDLEETLHFVEVDCLSL